MDPTQYDSETQMFIEPGHFPNVAVLEFTRWLIETGRLTGDTNDEPDGCHRPHD